MMSSIVFVAPTESLCDRAKKVIHAMCLTVPVIHSSDETAVRDVQDYPKAEVLISRGGLAEELKKTGNYSVVELGVSLGDILQAVQNLQERGCRTIGVVMRANILFDAMDDFEWGGSHIYICPCPTYEGIEAAVLRLKTEHRVDGIAGCRYAVQVAEREEMPCTYVDSNRASIMRALREAQRIVAAKQKESLQSRRLRAVIQNIHEGVLLLDEKRRPILWNETAEQAFDGRVKQDFSAQMDEFLRDYHGEQVLSLNGRKMLAQLVPVGIRNELVIMQKVENIVRSEHKVRASLYQRGLYARQNFADILTRSPAMQHTIAVAKRYARRPANILILGESGTGKESMAQSIHNESRRREGPFVSVNCAAIPENLIESELFGYVEGAFTGARRSGKQGLFELADKGTIFLDEIGDLPLSIQGRLLRVLQEHEIIRVGDSRIIQLDFRLICATNKDLWRMVEEGKFREDLYYRIKVLQIRLPPLRERREDILFLLRYYFRRFAPDVDFDRFFGKRVCRRLQEYSWPGNIRELCNIAEVCSCWTDEPLTCESLSGYLRDRSQQKSDGGSDLVIPLGIPLKEAEREIVRQTLEHYSPEEACARLGISRVTLWRKRGNG